MTEPPSLPVAIPPSTVASLDLARSGALHRAFPANWGEQHCVTCYKPWPCPDANAPTEAPDA